MKNTPKMEWGFVMESGDNNNSALTVETVATHVYFYSGVNQDRCLDLIKQLRNLDEKLRNERLTRSIPDDYPMTPIWLHILSPGGDLFTGLAVSDQIRQIETPVYSVAEGYCSSAATLISMSCTKRYIQPSAYMLIHQFSDNFWGTYEQFKDQAKLNDMLMERLVNFYVSRSDMEGDYVRDVLQRDSWFDAEQSLELGLVDEIVGG